MLERIPDDVRELRCGVGLCVHALTSVLVPRYARFAGETVSFTDGSMHPGRAGEQWAMVAGAGDRETANGTSNRPNRSARPTT
jgi:hypothetical protein